MRWIFPMVLAVTGMTALVWPQTVPNESQLQADFRHERDHFAEACNGYALKELAACGAEFVTDHPLHLAMGSIAPQNGFGLGLAFVTHYTPNENWRLSWDIDAVGATSASWRAGGYMKIIHTPPTKFVVHHEGDKTADSKDAEQAKKAKKPQIHPYTVFDLYAQAISLNKVTYFGLGPDTLATGRAYFGMQQTIVGGKVTKPVTEWAAIRGLNLSLIGEVNGRFVDLRGDHGESSPSIEQIYDNATAPGLNTQPGFVQLGEGFRIKPGLFNDHWQLNYAVNFQQFLAPSNSTYYFRRWTVDLDNQFPIYSKVGGADPSDTNGPDECAQSLGAEKCPSISYSRNRQGTIEFRLLMSESIASAGSAVPFYFQHTLGGSDIDGNPALSSYQDYRFRGPNLMLLHESFEHSIWGPVGFTFMADQGKVALARGDVDFNNLKHSFATGITLRAAGVPQLYFLFAWGGGEGNHTIGSLNTSLLGGSSRPSLY
jgi:hypothetical protein